MRKRGALTPPLQAFVELFDVDAGVLARAAERSPALKPANISLGRKRLALQGMPEEEKDAFLLRLLDDEPRLSLALHQHLGLHVGSPAPEAEARRAVGEVLGAI